MIRAALALYEATTDRAYLDRALAWQRAFDRHYGDPAGFEDAYQMIERSCRGLLETFRPSA